MPKILDELKNFFQDRLLLYSFVVKLFTKRQEFNIKNHKIYILMSKIRSQRCLR